MTLPTRDTEPAARVDPSRFRKKVFYPIPRRVAWMFVQATAFRLSPRPLWGWRAFLLRLFGAKVGRGVRLDSRCSVFDPRKLVLGDHCWVGPFVELYTVDTITVGDNVALAQHALLYTASHDIEDPEFPTVHAPIVIHDQAWVAACTFVGPGVPLSTRTGESSVGSFGVIA